jgi:hypothetical protein
MGGPFVRRVNVHTGVVSRKLVQSAMPLPAAESPIAESPHDRRSDAHARRNGC